MRKCKVKCQKDPTCGIFWKGDCSRMSSESRTVVHGLVPNFFWTPFLREWVMGVSGRDVAASRKGYGVKWKIETVDNVRPKFLSRISRPTRNWRQRVAISRNFYRHHECHHLKQAAGLHCTVGWARSSLFYHLPWKLRARHSLIFNQPVSQQSLRSNSQNSTQLMHLNATSHNL